MDWKSWKKFVLNEGISKGSMIGTSVQETLKMLEKYSDNTWIFFDTESTGLDQNKDQVTEVAGIAVSINDWMNPEIVETYHEKIKLNPDILRRLNEPDSEERKEWELDQSKAYRPFKRPQDVLSMTRYGERGRAFQDEQNALEGFKQFVLEQNNPILVAQNATHDMKFINGRIQEKLPRLPVIDTVPLIKFQLIPLLLAVGDKKNLKRIELHNMEQEKKQKFKQIYLDSKKILDKIKTKSGYSASLGGVAKGMQINADEWHNALADTKMLIDVFKRTVEILRIIEDYDLKTYFHHVNIVKKDRSLERFLKSKGRK